MRITILHHPSARARSWPYLVGYLSAAWSRSGHTISHVFGLDELLPDSGIVVLHVDLTVVPQDYRRAVDGRPVVINRGVLDISKHLFSETILSPETDYGGPVIVKTAGNFGGLIERKIEKFRASNGPFWMKMLSSLRKYRWVRKRRNAWRRRKWLKTYPIFDSVAQVPKGVWRNPHLIVEKFLPERGKDGSYHLREWIFLGNREIHYICTSQTPIIKGHNVENRRGLSAAEVPDSLRQVRSRFAFDFGKFDYGLHDGEAVLYDINKTPAGPKDIDAVASAASRIDELSQGLDAFQESVASR